MSALSGTSAEYSIATAVEATVRRAKTVRMVKFCSVQRGWAGAGGGGGSARVNGVELHYGSICESMEKGHINKRGSCLGASNRSRCPMFAATAPSSRSARQNAADHMILYSVGDKLKLITLQKLEILSTQQRRFEDGHNLYQ